MTEDPQFRLTFLLLLVAIKGARWWIHRREGAAQDHVDLHDARLALLYVLPTEIVAWLYILVPSTLDWAQLPCPHGVRWLGTIPGLTGLVLFVWAHRALGPDFSVFLRPREEHRLVISGPYRYVRHPIYSSAFLVGAALFLLSANGVVGAVWLGGVSLFFAWRIPREEAMMIERFGDRYLEYMQTTGRLWPRFGGRANVPL